MKKIAILLTVFNRKEKTKASLSSIYNLSLPQDELTLDVYVVDDGSTDGTSSMIRNEFPQVHIIEGTGNLFWNRGMHLAWEHASKEYDYDYYLWLNDDTFFYKTSLEVLMKTSLQKENKDIIIGTTSALGNPKRITYGGRTDSSGIIPPTDYPQSCDYFNGNIVLIPRHVYKIVGKNDRFFRHALGDFDYGLRAAKMGIPLTIAPGILGECDEHENLATWCDPAKPFIKRWKTFRSPLGQHPEEFFVFERRHNGFFRACFHYMTNHLRVVLPILWNRRNKNNLNIMVDKI